MLHVLAEPVALGPKIIGSLEGVARTADGVTDEDLFSTGEVWHSG